MVIAGPPGLPPRWPDSSLIGHRRPGVTAEMLHQRSGFGSVAAGPHGGSMVLGMNNRHTGRRLYLSADDRESLSARPQAAVKLTKR
jgi:hypothetical protein